MECAGQRVSLTHPQISLDLGKRNFSDYHGSTEESHAWIKLVAHVDWLFGTSNYYLNKVLHVFTGWTVGNYEERL